MAEQGPCSARRSFGLEAWRSPQVAPRQHRHPRQSPKSHRDARTADDESKAVWRHAATRELSGDIDSSANPKVIRRRHIKQPRRHHEQPDAPLKRLVRIRYLLKQDGPTRFQFGELRAANTPRQQLPGHCLKPRFGRYLSAVQFLQPFPPPGELDRSKRGLGRGCDHFPHRIVDIEQRIEGGPQIRRPIQPDEVPVAPRRFSDSRPP